MAGRSAKWAWHMTSDPLPWFASFGIAVRGNHFRTSVEQATHESAGTERLAADGGAIGPERVAQRHERTARVRSPAACVLPGAGRRGLGSIDSLTWHTCWNRGTRPRGPCSTWLLIAARKYPGTRSRSGCSLAGRWFEKFPRRSMPPTLLDIDPAAARGDKIDASAPLWLLRPERMEDVR